MVLHRMLCGGPAYIEIEIVNETATHRVIDNGGKSHTTWSMLCAHTNFQSKRAMLTYCKEHRYQTIPD